MTSSTVKPASKFSNTVATGIRVPLNTHAPLRLPGMLSTAGHWDQSRVAMFLSSFHRSLFLAQFGGGVTRRIPAEKIRAGPLETRRGRGLKVLFPLVAGRRRGPLGFG